MTVVAGKQGESLADAVHYLDWRARMACDQLQKRSKAQWTLRDISAVKALVKAVRDLIEAA